MFAKHLIAPILILSGLLACGGGGGATATANGTLTLKLGSDSSANYSQVYVSVEKVEVKNTSSSSWSTLATVKKTYDLMALQNGNGVTLASGASLAVGTYNARITWATQNYYVDASAPGNLLPNGDTTNSRMTLPTTTTATGTLTIAAETLTTGEIFIQGNQMAQYHGSLPYVFQATAELVDLSGCAAITGHVYGSSSTPISGAEVFAETVDGAGTATVKRRAMTGSGGAFTLEGLATGKTYYLATQPGGSTLAYSATSTSGVTASAATTYSGNDLTCSSSATPGSLAVSITPISSAVQGTWVELRKTITTGSNSHTLVVRSQTVATGTSSDATTFVGLLPDAYGVVAQRSTSGGDPTATAGNEETVTAGQTTDSTVTIN